MVNVPVPSSALKFCEIMSQLTQTDMYPTDEIYGALFNFSETKTYNYRFETLGYEGSNFIMLSGSGLINLNICVLTCLIQLILIFACKKLFRFESMRLMAIKLSNDYPIAAIVRLFLTIYLEFMLSAFIWLKAFFIKDKMIFEEASERRRLNEAG